MNLNSIKNVSMNGGLIKPTGIRYTPKSVEELERIENKIEIYGFSGSSDQWNHANFSFISFILDNVNYYIDISTVYIEIRENKINELI